MECAHSPFSDELVWLVKASDKKVYYSFFTIISNN